MNLARGFGDPGYSKYLARQETASSLRGSDVNEKHRVSTMKDRVNAHHVPGLIAVYTLPSETISSNGRQSQTRRLGLRSRSELLRSVPVGRRGSL